MLSLPPITLRLRGWKLLDRVALAFLLRCFDSPADAFFVQYEGEIKESVIKLMEELARAKAIFGREVFYGIIDRNGTYRLRLAYPSAFKSK